jgi:signal transduction histidine kinase
MRNRKLLTYASRNYLVSFLVLLAISFGAFYFIMRVEVTRNIDEILSNRRNHIIQLLKTDRANLPAEAFGFTDFSLTPIKALYSGDIYADTLIYEDTDQEYDEYRKLITSFAHEGVNYRLEIVKAHLESTEILNTVVFSLSLIFLLMLAVLFLTTTYFSERLWRPFYATLNKLKTFQIDKAQLNFDETKVLEFQELNTSLADLTKRAQQSFVNQKQFTENASHEMQTPLAVLQSNLEMLITDNGITQAQSEKVQTLLDATQRLSRLNKTLLLLSKIENQQFADSEQVDLKAMVEKLLTYFEGQQESLNIKVSISFNGTRVVQGNPMLLEVLMSNLIKNAFLHNVAQGFVNISVGDGRVEIRNSSSSGAIPNKQLYQRFFKGAINREGWGLGLAIAKKICEVSGWTLSYAFAQKEHSFTVTF